MIKRKVKKKENLLDLIREYDIFLDIRSKARERLQKLLVKSWDCKHYIGKYGCMFSGCKNCCMFCGDLTCVNWDNCSYFEQVLMKRETNGRKNNNKNSLS